MSPWRPCWWPAQAPRRWGWARLTVQSALGETMRAEIDITSLSAEEASTLKVRVAPPESYRATGVEYNPVLTSTQVQVGRQGRPHRAARQQ